MTIALGSTEVSPLNMAAAYAAIANDGVYIEPTFYTKVVDSDGNVLYEYKHKKEAEMGHLVPCGIIEKHPEWFCDQQIPYF